MTGEELLAEYAGGRRDFRGTVLAGVDLSGEILTDAAVAGVDLSGAAFAGVDLSGLYARGANLTGANLTGADLTHANLTGANLHGADLRGANLTGARLNGVNLSDANLTGARGLPPTPVVEDLHRRVAEAVGADGQHLDMAAWHRDCGTVHCRAGWAITLAGAAGAELEEELGPCAAGALIYHASTGAVPYFFAQHAEALADVVLSGGA